MKGVGEEPKQKKPRPHLPHPKESEIRSGCLLCVVVIPGAKGSGIVKTLDQQKCKWNGVSLLCT